MSLLPNSLGRSIGEALARAKPTAASRGYLEVDLGLIRPSDANPRQRFDEAPLQQLAESLAQHGMLEPIVVVRRDPGYEVVAGERRYRAAKLAGWTKVPVVILDDAEPRHLAELRLIENLQREDLTPVEVARAYAALAEQHGLTHEQIAKRVGQDRASVSNAIRILGLGEHALALVAARTLSAGHAKVLLAVSDAERQRRLAEQCVAEGLSVRALERLVQDAGPVAPARSAPAPADPRVRELEQNLALLLKTRVSIRSRGNDRGELTIHFDGKEQFNSVVAIMGQILKKAGLGG